jgi:hypothetical protein
MIPGIAWKLPNNHSRVYITNTTVNVHPLLPPTVEKHHPKQDTLLTQLYHRRNQLCKQGEKENQQQTRGPCYMNHHRSNREQDTGARQQFLQRKGNNDLRSQAKFALHDQIEARSSYSSRTIFLISILPLKTSRYHSKRSITECASANISTIISPVSIRREQDASLPTHVFHAVMRGVYAPTQAVETIIPNIYEFAHSSHYHLKKMTFNKKQESENMTGTLYGGGSESRAPIEPSQKPPQPTSYLPSTGVVKVAVLQPVNTTWNPPELPQSTKSDHPLEATLNIEGLQRIKNYCRQPSHSIIVQSSANPKVFIQTFQLQNLISHGKPINDEVVALFLEIVCSFNNHAFLCPQIIPLIRRYGKSTFTNYFANPLRKKYRTIYKPSMSGEDGIAITCFVNNCHWISVVRREVGRQVFFCYSDDLNCPETEQDIRTLLSQDTCPKFYPSYAKWINCKSYTYSPHSNECGPRTLLATVVMLLHPNPHENILLPYMDPNLAQLTRTWVAQTILTGEPSFPSAPKSNLHTL